MSLRAVIFTIFVLVCAFSGNAHAQIDVAAVHFELRYPGVALRAAPSALAARGAVMPQGANLRVIARTRDGGWLAVQGDSVSGWIATGFGEVQGQPDAVALAPANALAPIARNVNKATLPSWIYITAHGREIFDRALRDGRDGRMFTVAGDSNSAWPRSLGRLVSGQYDVMKDVDARAMVARFDPGFAHVSSAVGGGYGTDDMFRAERAGAACASGELPLACELRLSNAAVVFVQLGTGDKFTWRNFEANLRRVVKTVLEQKATPVLVTKADDLESIQGGGPDGHINAVIRAMAAEYDLPWIDFYAATRTLPAVPNPNLPKRPFTQFGLHDEWGYYFHLTEQGQDLRLRCTLQMLDALTRGK